MTLFLESYGGFVEINALGDGDLEDAIVKGLGGLFARRYLPSFSLERGPEKERRKGLGAVIDWFRGDSFSIKSIVLRDLEGYDYYSLLSPPPQPYVNESPYFFLLQVLSRVYARRGLVMITDSVSFSDSDGRAVLVLGYPHGGKSTILAIALARGFKPVTTENTLVRTTSEGLEIVGGSRVLVVDPRSLERYSLDLGYKPDEKTRHGYLVFDLESRLGRPKSPLRVEAIYVVHCSFASQGASLERVRGRKIAKIFWHFASSIPRGTDFYEPGPPSLATPWIDRIVAELVSHASEKYRDRFYEVFGSHDKAFELMAREVWS